MVGVELDADRVGPATGAYLLERVIQRGALARSLQMAGAMERIAEMTVGYVWERKQFGRPIGSFQAVQQHLVLLNSEAAAASMAVAVVVATGETAKRRAEVGLAKEIANSAATIVARLAHQAHGAIGMTEEYELQQYTRRLWVWRQEFGSSTYWRARIGTEVVAAGADRLWDRLTGVGSRRSLA